MAKTKRILFTGGGSGGHIYPLLAVANEIQRLSVENQLVVELFYMGPRDEYAGYLERAGMRIRPIAAAKMRRYLSVKNILDVPKFVGSVLQAFFKMFWIMPDAIFSKGGPGAFPVVLAGWFFHIPIIIHESDTIPGLTNLLSARFATRIAVSFEKALNYFNPKKAAYVGGLVRTEFLREKPTQEIAKEELGFEKDKPLLLVIGGSQGSQRINQFVLENLNALIAKTQILHQTGSANFLEIEKLSRAALITETTVQAEIKYRYKVMAYLDKEMINALAGADLIVSRAGSSSIFEIAAFGKPAILIPLEESASDHQRMNAYEFARTGAAVVIEEKNLLPGIFLGQIRDIMGNQNRLREMSVASEKFFKPGAAEIIAEELLRFA